MLSTSEMVHALTSDVPQPYRKMIGFEYEVPCFHRKTLLPLKYEGDVGMRAMMLEVARLTKREAIPAQMPVKVPLADGGLISMEPGGQFEFSSAPVETFADCLAQLGFFIDLLRQLQKKFDLHYFFGGVTPVHTVDDIGLITTTKRYQIMNDYFPRVGTMGRKMMRQSASLQVTFDYKNPAIGVDLVRTAQYVAPLAAAMFANAPYVDGQRTPHRSFRVPIWENTDPARSGMLPGFTRLDYDFSDYVNYIVQAPMFFVQQPDGDLIDAAGMTFAQFNERGFCGRAVTMDDFLLHNSTIFNDVRLKRTVEVRTIDAQRPALVPAVIAFLSGLLLCDAARQRAKLPLLTISEDDYRQLPDLLSRNGLQQPIGDTTAQALFLTLIDLAAEGLQRCLPDGAAAVPYLTPIRTLVAQGYTPADVVIAQHGADAHSWLAATVPLDYTAHA